MCVQVGRQPHRGVTEDLLYLAQRHAPCEQQGSSRVPQSVKRNQRDAGPPSPALKLACQVRSIQRRPMIRRQNEIEVLPRGPGGESSLDLPMSVLAEELCDQGRYGERPPALHRLERQLLPRAIPLLVLPLNVDCAAGAPLDHGDGPTP